MKVFATLACLAAASKVTVQLLFESECPFCRKFLTTQLKSVWADADFKSQIELDLVAYGNARAHGLRTHCQHGPTECHGNILENCLEHYAPAEGYDYADAVICLEGADTDFDSALPQCVPQAAAAKVALCAKGPEGLVLQKKAAQRTPAHKYVPWVNINGQHSEAAQDNLMKALCDLVPRKPAACSQLPEPAPLAHVSLAAAKPKVTILYESECPGCQELLTTDVKRVWADATFRDELELELIAYGNAREQGGAIECQHGAEECYGNIVENCMEQHAAAAGFEYATAVICVESAKKGGQAFDAALAACVPAAAAKQVTACAKGAEGKQLQKKAAQRTPAHDYVPWVILDGEHSEAAQKDFVKTLCAAVSDKPALCKEEHAPRDIPASLNAERLLV